MGGKTKTYTDLQTQALFDGQDNLFGKEIVRLFAITKNIDPYHMGKSMVLASQKYYAAEKFNALGIASEIKGTIKKITKDGVLNFLSNKVTSPELFYFTSKDINDNGINLRALKIKQQLEENYNVDTSHKKIYSYTFSNEIKYNIDDYNAITQNTDGVDTVTIEVETNAYEIEPGNWYELYKDTLSNGNAVLKPLSTGTVQGIEIAEDNRTVYICNYSYDESGTTTLGNGTYFFKDDMQSEAYEYNFLMLPLKDEGEMISDKKYVKAVLNDLGLGNGVLDESLAANEIKRSLISHSTSLHDEDYIDIIKQVYGYPGNFNEVTMHTDKYDIKYHTTTNLLHSYQITIDDNSFNLAGTLSQEDDKNVVMLPLEELRKEPMHIRYEHIKKTLRIWANTSVTVKLKWYQTGFFKFLTIIVSAIISITTANPTALLLAVGAPVVLGLISNLFGPEVAAVVAILYVAFTFDFSKATHIETFSTVSNIVNQMSQVYFTIENKSMTKEINQLNKEDEVAHKAISEMRKQTLYIPFDSYTNYYDGMYSIGTEAYSTVYDSAFNFDIMLKPKLGVIDG